MGSLWDYFEDEMAVPSPQMSSEEQSVLNQIYNLIQEQETGWGIAQEEMMGEMGDFGYRKEVTEGEWHEGVEYNQQEKDLMAAVEGAHAAAGTPVGEPGGYPTEEYKQNAIYGHYNAYLMRYGMATTSENRSRMNALYNGLKLREPERWKDPDKIDWVEMTEEEWREQATEGEILDYENRLEAKRRQQLALKGELPLTEAGQERKRKEREHTEEALRRAGVSPNSTAWIQTMSEFDERWARVEEAERYGQLAQGTQNLLGIAQLDAARINQIGSTYTGLQSGTQGLMQSYAGYMQPYTSYNMAGYQAQAANQAAVSGLLSSLFGVGGTTAGMFANYYTGGTAAQSGNTTV